MEEKKDEKERLERVMSSTLSLGVPAPAYVVDTCV